MPGQKATVTVSGHDAGPIGVELLRVVDPTAARTFADPERAGELDAVESRTVRLDGDYRPTSVTFTLDQAGIYLVRTTRGDQTRLALVQATDVSFLTKTGPSNGLLYAFRLPSGEPLQGARAFVNGTEAGRTGADGVLALDPARLDGPIVLVSPEGNVGVGEGHLGTWGSGERAQVVAQFDRPIYRPGQAVQYRATAFVERDGRFVPDAAEAIRVRVLTWAHGSEEVVHEATLRPDAFGTVAGAFDLRDDAPLGHYGVQLSTPRGAHGWASVEVQAYEKPRVKVEAEAAREHYVQGEEVLLLAKASWFFGSPLNRGTVRYAVSSSPYWGGWDPCPYCGYALSSARGYGGYAGYDVHGSYGAPVHEGSGELRPDGSYALRFEPPASDQPRAYVAEFHVTSETGELQTGTLRFVVHPSGVSLRVTTDRHAYERGDAVTANAVVTDHAGRPLAGVPVTLRLQEERGEWSQEAETTTDAAGRAAATLDAPARGGGFTLHAIARDAAGREANAMQWLWVADEAAFWGGGDAITLLPERGEYRPGETARVLVLSARPADVLVTLEGRDLHAWSVVRVTEGGAFVELPVGEDAAPGVFVTATSVRRDGGMEHGPRVDHGQTQIRVGPDPRELNLTITPDKPVYRDGDEARVLVQARDAQGRPVVAQVGLGIVDASIYALREDANGLLRDALYPLAHGVRTSYAWQGIAYWDGWHGSRVNATGAMAFQEMAATPALALDAAAMRSTSSSPDVRVREEFPDTALWLPLLVTDGQGVARVALTAPDTLTEWRVSVRAHTMDGLAADARQVFHTRKPLMVELATPRFVVQGDHLNVTAVVFNHVGEMRDVEVQLEGAGAAALVGSGYRRVTLSDGDSVRIDFPVHVTDDASALANLTVVARAAGEPEESDAMRVKLPVLPHGVLETAARAGVDDATFGLAVPQGPYAAPPVARVTLAPTVAGAMLDALPYLVGFPYGCVEQTMSRFMPSVVATRALRDAGYDVENPQLPEYVEAGLERLATLQHADGGWGWWENDETRPYMTAYAVSGLAEAKRAGAEVAPAMLARGAQRLTLQYEAEDDPVLRAYAAYALALAGVPPGEWPAQETLPPDGLALLGLGKLAAGDRDGARAALDALKPSAIRDGGRLRWEGTDRGWGLHAIRSDVQLTAHALRLMVGLGDADAPLAVAWLAEQRHGGAWSTTKDTAESILAIVEYLQATDELSPDFEAIVRVGDHERRVAFRGDARDLDRASFEIPIDPALAGSDLPVTVEREGAGRLYWTVVLESVPRAQRIEAAAQGLRVEKRIVDSGGAEARDLAFGEEYRVWINVTSPQARSYVLLKDLLPAGVEVVRQPQRAQHHVDVVCLGGGCGGGWWGWGPWSNVEARDDHVAAFATELPQGTTTFSYVVRAVQPGEYHVLPARAEAMYQPDVWGRSGETHVRVGQPPRLLLGTALVRGLDVSVRVQPVGETPLQPMDVEAVLLDGAGEPLPLGQVPEIVPLDDGSLDVRLRAAAPLPDVVTVRLGAPEFGVAAKRLDATGAPHRFDGGFAPDALALWSAGPVVDASKESRESPRADPALFRFDPAPEPQPLPPREEEPDAGAQDDARDERRWIPAAGLLGAGVAVAVAAFAARRRLR